MWSFDGDREELNDSQYLKPERPPRASFWQKLARLMAVFRHGSLEHMTGK